MLFLTLSSHLVPLRTKYSPQHHILKHPQPTFLPQCQRPRFTPIQNKSKNYSPVHLNLYIFGYQTGGQKILHLVTASIPWLKSALNFYMNRSFIRSGSSKYLKSSTFAKHLLLYWRSGFFPPWWSVLSFLGIYFLTIVLTSDYLSFCII